MRDSQKQALQVELNEKVLARIVVIQRWVRAKLLRCRFLHLRRCAIILQVSNNSSSAFDADCPSDVYMYPTRGGGSM